MSTKRCAKCSQEKPLIDFSKQARAKDGLHSYCRPCNSESRSAWERANPERVREHALWRNYRLTAGDYQAMLITQSGVCASCKRPPRNGKPLYVDHCHTTGHVRALLCQACNSMLGMADDIPEYLEAGAAYLRLHASAHSENTHGGREQPLR